MPNVCNTKESSKIFMSSIVSALWNLVLWLWESLWWRLEAWAACLRMAGQSLSNYTVQHAHFVDEEIGPNKARGLPKIIQPSSGRASPGIWISYFLPEAVSTLGFWGGPSISFYLFIFVLWTFLIMCKNRVVK